MWVGQPREVSESSGVSAPLPQPSFWAATLECGPYFDDWTQYDAIHVYHQSIVPGT